MKEDGTIDRIIDKYATSPLADVTTSFAKNECAKYDNYTRGELRRLLAEPARQR